MAVNDNSAQKVCTACGDQKGVGEFYAHPKMAAGVLSQCKECVKARVRKHRRDNDSVREYDRSRGARMSGEAVRKYRARHPEAYRAHSAVSNAVRDGRLAKEPCLFCGETKVHGHHRDYSKPLDVIWLCAKCHHRLHANFPETAAHEPKHKKAA